MKTSRPTLFMTVAAAALASSTAVVLGPCRAEAPPQPVDPIVAASPFAAASVVSYASQPGPDGKPAPIPWSQFKPDDYGPTPVVFDNTGVRQIRPAPAPGVHPRIVFTPDDLPDIRRRLQQTKSGQQAWRNILCWVHGMKGDYDASASYAQPDVMKGGWGGLHGPVPLFRLGSSGKVGDRYRRLVAGDTSQPAGFFWNVYALEAFRCLIDGDSAGGRQLASAVMTSLAVDRNQTDPKLKTGPLYEDTQVKDLAFVYDLDYAWLTPEQRQAIHDILVTRTENHDNYGTFEDPTSSRSNWATFSYWLMAELAIEGEPGFNDLKFRGLYRGYRNKLTYGFFPEGCTFEGEAKDQIGMDGIIALAMRAQKYGLPNLAGHPHARAFVTKFLPYSVMPYGGEFMQFDLLGSPHNRPYFMDWIGAKYMYPDDPTVDWVYRNAVGEHYENVPDRPDGYYNPLLFAAIFAMDFDPANDNPAKIGLGPSYFCGERALMLTRSDWSKNALLLGLHTRTACGGHAYPDRNSLLLAGKGRVWSMAQGHNVFDNSAMSTVIVDGKPQDLAVPARVVDYQDGKLATFAVGDAKYSWDWNYRRAPARRGAPYTVADARSGRVAIPAGWQPETHSFNDFSYTRSDVAYLNAPLFEQPSWLLPKGVIDPMLRQPNYPVAKAFRTAGLVRGANPYALVVDDIQKDSSVHHYDWDLAIEPDLQIARIEHPSSANQGESQQFDVYLAAKGAIQPDGSVANGAPVLLVRVLNVERSAAPQQGDAYLRDAQAPDRNHPDRSVLQAHMLDIPADAISPSYKVLLYPFIRGVDPLPKTDWSADRKAVTIDFGAAQRDQATFTPASSGKTDLSVARLSAAGPTQLIAINRPVPSLKDDQPLLASAGK